MEYQIKVCCRQMCTMDAVREYKKGKKRENGNRLWNYMKSWVNDKWLYG